MRLSFRSGEREGQVVDVRGERFELGRDPTCDLTVPDVKASRRHARLELRAEAPATITDLGSSNGTFVGGERIAGSRELRGGEEIRIGDTTLVPEVPAAGETARISPPDREPRPVTQEPLPLLAQGWDSARRRGAGRLRDHRGVVWQLGFGLAFSVFGALFVGVIWQNYREDREVVATGERVTARVEARNEDNGLEIAFRLADGRIARTSVPGGGADPQRTVEIAYDPSDPTRAERVDGAGDEPHAFVILVALLVGLPLSLVAHALWLWRKLRRALDPDRRRIERAWACARTVDPGPQYPSYSTISIFDRPDQTATWLVADTWPGDVIAELDMAPVTLEGDIRVGGAGILSLAGGPQVTLQGFRRPRLRRRKRPRPLGGP